MLLYVLLFSILSISIVTLLSFVKDPSGPIQVIVTKLDSTPSTVFTVHMRTCRLPTIAPCMGPDGDIVTVGRGTVKIKYY